MPRIPCLLAIAATVLLAGCSHMVKVPLLGTIDNSPPPSRTTALERLKSEQPCCHAWSDLPFHDALPPRPREFSIDRFTPVADLDGHKTHFLTFVLPKFKHSYRIAFKAEPSARGLSNSFLLAPTATVLNSDYQPLSATNVALCVYINWRPSMSGAFGAIKIDNPNARYVVITTSRKQLAATTYWAQSPTSFSNVNVPANSVFGGVTSAAPVTSGDYNVAHGPEGTLYVGRMTSGYAAAVDNGLCGRPRAGAGLLPEIGHALQNL